MAAAVVGLNMYNMRTYAAANEISASQGQETAAADQIGTVPTGQDSMLLHLLDKQYDKKYNQIEEQADTSLAYYYEPSQKTLASASNMAALGNSTIQEANPSEKQSSAPKPDKQDDSVETASVAQASEKTETAPSILAAAGAIEKPASIKPEAPAKNDLFVFYEVQPGETLASIAAKFGLEEKTLIMEAQLPEDQQKNLKPGFVITVVPDNGVTARVQRGDTLTSIASRYGVPNKVEEIMHDNELTSDQDLTEGDLLFIKGGNKSVPKKPEPQPTRLATNNRNASRVTSDDTPRATTPSVNPGRRGSHSFPYGYCTWWAAKQVGGVPWGGNAKAWLANAAAMGYPTGRTPRVGSIVVTNDSRYYGHVAYVIAVKGNSFVVSEMNFMGFGKVNTREIPTGSGSVKGFIYY